MSPLAEPALLGFSSGLMFSLSLQLSGAAPKLAALLTLLFMTGLFYRMMRTKEVHRWRRIFLVALGLLFPAGFIWDLITLRGSMSIAVGQ
jgi:ABC-type cobalamin transport system permease subunit